MTTPDYRFAPDGWYRDPQGSVRRSAAGGRVSYGMGGTPQVHVDPQNQDVRGVPYPYGTAYPQGYLVGQQGYPAGAVPAYGYGAQAAPPPKKRRWGLVVVIILIIVCLAAAALLALTVFGAGPSKSRAGAPGQLEGKTAAEIQAELDRQVEEGMFNISIASVAQFADGASEGELRIENVPGNRYLMQVVITLDATGEQVYESGIIEPDHHIQRDRLSVDLDPGTYDATATFMALDPQTEEEAGRAAAKMLIQVMG